MPKRTQGQRFHKKAQFAPLLEFVREKIPKIEASLQKFLHKLKTGELGINLGGLYEPLEVALISFGGKRIRPLLVYLAHDLVGGRSSQLDDAAILPELPHKGSVVEDDIEDGALQRDGKDPLYKSYGIGIASNTAGILYNLPPLLLKNLELDQEQRQKILVLFNNLYLRARLGQGKDLAWTRFSLVPSEEEYLQMCSEKNAAFEVSARVGVILGNAKEEQEKTLAEIARLTAISYQLADDLLSLNLEAHDYGADITQGKITLMTIKTFESSPEGAIRLKTILSMRTANPVLTKEAIEIMEHCGAITYARRKAEELISKSQQILERSFPESPQRQILSELIAYSMARKN